MSEGDVSLIRDEDVLRRMWQQTEDFSRKKEIRAHMYRLREERLRNLYTPEPAGKIDGKGCEFTTSQGHVKSFADQSFQSMKSKEVRDAGSPPKEFTYRGQDLKELSNAGWNVESENRTTDDGHTHLKAVHANIEGHYDVEGGRGQFAAVDHHKQAITEYDDGNTSLRKNESASNTAAHEQVVRKTDDGTHFSSTTNSSTSSSKFQQVSSTKHEAVPYITDENYDLSQQTYDNTNRNEEINIKRQTDRHEDFNQSLRKTDFEHGDLVSRKVEYPDDNTKVIIETRCLPDGTRVTSTRREFQAPVMRSSQTQQHSQETSSKSKTSYSSSEQRSDKRETSSIKTRVKESRTSDIVDSQRNKDDVDFKVIERKDFSTTDLKNVDDHDYRKTVFTKHSTISQENDEQSDFKRKEIQSDYSTKSNYDQSTDYQCTKRYESNIDDTDRHEILTTRDNQDVYHKVQQTDLTKNKNEQIQKISNERKTEEVVERKTSRDQYQTTYQSDYTQRKISEDLSPSHQAWASTLRADTPSSTQPTTRASSPGSRTFRSSTSSLRSSISPDKFSKKPPSRGGSPSKTDRFSPSRTTSEKYTSTHSVSESKTYRNTSPERRYHYGTSPTRPSLTPDRKPLDDQRERLSKSPEKKPQDSKYRPSLSPERKLDEKIDSETALKEHSQTKPRKTPENTFTTPPLESRPDLDNTLSKRPSQSPHRKPDYRKPSEDNQHSTQHPRMTSPSSPYTKDDISKRLSASPDRKPGLKLSNEHAGKSPEKSVSPDRKPSNMRPTSASESKPSADKPSLPTKQHSSPERTSPAKHVISQSPDRKPHSYDKTVKDEHYKFINEETKLYSHWNKTENTKRKSSPSPEKYYRTLDSPSPVRKTPTKDITEVGSSKSQSPDARPSRKDIRSPSPPKGHVTFIKDHAIENSTIEEENKKKHTTMSDITNNASEKVTNFSRTSKSDDKATPNKADSRSRESSPNKFGTYDKKQRRLEETNDVIVAITTKINDSAKHDTQNRQEKSSSPKKRPEISTSASKRPLRHSTSPIKSPNADNSKFEQNIDFITNEGFTEETNKKAGIKERPRQLITPSTSPTRKPKPEETAPSTGQSSPTTSVSGFVYFGSPRNEETIVTDLDDQDFYSENKTSTRTEELDVYRSKIPCRSPSPQKRESPTKDKLPRKSSLKKPHVDQDSPTEKPPSSFRVSPTVETRDYSERQTIEKEDHSDDLSPDSTNKTKPPLERRETYEERCRKILGMMEDDTIASKNITKETTSFLKEPSSNLSSPSVSPCRTPKEESPFREGVCRQDVTDNKINTTDFLTQEQLNTIKSTRRPEISTTRKSKTPSRETSPTKLQDIISHSKINTDYDENSSSKQTITTTDEAMEKEIFSAKRTRELGPDKIFPRQTQGHQSPVSPDLIKSYPKNDYLRKQNRSPERKSGIEKSNLETKSEIPGPISSFNNENPTETINEKQSMAPQFKKSASPDKTIPNPQTSQYTDAYTTINKMNTSSTNTMTTDITQDTVIEKSKHFSAKPLVSTPKKSNEPLKTVVKSDVPKDKTNLTEILRHSRTPSPTKNITKTTEESLEFITTEREQEILNKVKKSLRKLSPNRNQKSPNSDESQKKSTEEVNTLDKKSTQQNTEITESESRAQINVIHSTVTSELHDDKINEQKTVVKQTSRNVSPIKKATITSPKTDKSPEMSAKSRSISPRKPISPTEQSLSPSLSRTSGFKPKESIMPNRKTMPIASLSKVEKNIVSDVRKSGNVPKQTNVTKISTKTFTNKTISSKPSETETKRAPTPKSVKDNVNLKKDTDTKVTRTSSDISMKSKKLSPQRIKSKPEIQINDLSPTKTTKHMITTTKIQKTNISKDLPTKLASKPKSATSLNTSVEDDDVIVDVQQAKSSRENSPDRICPTPVNFMDDVGTPRFPDEVSEPDDDFCKRTHQIIHETESIVDDIVEICEDDELFSKKNNDRYIADSDDYLLNVSDKVSKFSNKIDKTAKPNETTLHFKNTEIKAHSDITTESHKKDECLLSVSEKVNKFAKGPRDKKDNRSPSRRIENEFDKDTVYQDDYTKLSVNDKAHLFVETAENVKSPKIKPVHKVERPDLSNVDESLKSDDCLLSVSDKVNKFVKTAEQFLNETQDVEEKEKKIKEQHDKIMKNIVETIDDEEQIQKPAALDKLEKKSLDNHNNKVDTFSQETAIPNSKIKDITKAKSTGKTPTVKITTLRSSEAVKKAKALFENIATTQKTNDTYKDTKSTKLMDIGVTKKFPKTDSTIVLHPSLEDGSPNLTDVDSEIDAPHVVDPKIGTTIHQTNRRLVDKPRGSPSRFTTSTAETTRTVSPMRHIVESNTLSKVSHTRHTTGKRPESPRPVRPDSDKSEKIDQVPGYQRPTKTSLIKEEIKTAEEIEVSSRRGSGKFGVELRRTSAERSTVSSERRRSSVDHHQPCIEDIFDLDLLEQMLEKVVGYEQRRRIRSQIRIAKKKLEDDEAESQTHIKTIKQTTTVTKSSRTPDRQTHTKSPERQLKSSNIKTSPVKTISPDRQPKEQIKPVINGHKEPIRNICDKRPQSSEKTSPKPAPKTRSPVRQPSPDKRTRTQSPTKPSPSPVGKPKSNRFNEYASAYMKKVGLNESDKINYTETKIKKAGKQEMASKKINKQQEEIKTESKVSTTSTKKSVTERTSSKETIEIVHMNGKRSSSPEKKHSPERNAHSPTERLQQRTPSPDFKRPRETAKKETIIKTEYDVEKKIPPKPVQDEKPSWVTNRNLKKITSETRTFSSKKIESEKPKYRAPSPSKIISKPIDVITSSYGPGPLDADGKPLFGIKALRNGATNYQVKGTVIRQEFHSRNGGEPEGTVSVTAYSSEPEELERLLSVQGDRPSRLHGLAAITTTKKFGGDTGTTLKEAHTKEDRAFLERFTHSDRKVIDSKVESFTENTSMDIRQKEKFADNRGIENRRDEKVVEFKRVERKPEERLRNKSVEKREERVGANKDKPRSQRTEEKTERKAEDRKTVRQSSVKSLTEKYIKSASDTSKSERSTYPKAGLILRTVSMKDSVSSDSSNHAGLARTDSEHSLGSMDDNTVVTTTTTERVGDGQRTTTTTRHQTSHGQVKRTQERSFLDSTTKVTGVQDILTRMKNADIVIEDGDSCEDAEARALLNKFLGATVLMAGMQNYVTEKPTGKVTVRQETVRTSSGGDKVTSQRIEKFDLDQCWDERVLRKLLDECSDYEQRRRLRARLRTLMAEQEACASAVTEALAAAGEGGEGPEGAPETVGGEREEEEVTTVTSSSVRRDSSEKIVSTSTTTETSKVIESMSRPAPKPVSPFAKFRQLEKQNSTNTPNSPKTPQSPGSPSQPYFKFTDPALQLSALTIKERLLQWCRDKTRDYENVKLENFSTSWADGLAFCALLHHFLPDAFDYSKLTPDKRRQNFTLAFKLADEKAGIYPLLDVDDMVAMRKPDWKCVFTYVQAIHRRFKDQD